MRFRVALRRWKRVGVLALACGLVPSACGSVSSVHPRFGADEFSRTRDTNGLPTYAAHGHLAFREQAEEKVAKVMQEACPAGNPRIVFGYTRFGDIGPRSWSATFTCNDVIPLD